MKRSFEIHKIETAYSTVSAKEYNQLLDEWAEVVYSYFCQLQKDQIKASETFNKKAGA